MQLNPIAVTSKNCKDIDRLEKLARESFPPLEFVDPIKLIELEKSEGLCFWELYDKNLFVGFMTVISYGDITYLYYMAIEPNLREKGYGQKALDVLKELYLDTHIVVDEEILDEKAENYEQRKKRRAFYLHNGFKPTGHYFNYLGIDYELLCTSDNFDFDTYKQMSYEIEKDGYRSKYY